MMINDIKVEVSDTTMLNKVQMPVTKKFSPANISSNKQETRKKVSTILYHLRTVNSQLKNKFCTFTGFFKLLF
jgi:hypothetical protein